MAGAYDHLLRLIVGLAGLCRKLGVPFFFEAPRTSWVWSHGAVEPLTRKWNFVSFDFCQYREPWVRGSF
eukprot:9358889-Lingulodinium_polyedra.AAC.1